MSGRIRERKIDLERLVRTLSPRRSTPHDINIILRSIPVAGDVNVNITINSIILPSTSVSY